MYICPNNSQDAAINYLRDNSSHSLALTMASDLIVYQINLCAPSISNVTTKAGGSPCDGNVHDDLRWNHASCMVTAMCLWVIITSTCASRYTRFERGTISLSKHGDLVIILEGNSS
ncbi:uncharacterized protein LOC122196828 isoform X1 [Lactuca sativa]|uniref:uncharacterized protein LOC122196828 isoform X1 n=2 Tax=Lactuca sativa TaxID=4236 RepID=UPI001C68EA5D|nr:uncharacterized protein LOC122196828 isoform X1 [Lactuca sativa]